MGLPAVALLARVGAAGWLSSEAQPTNRPLPLCARVSAKKAATLAACKTLAKAGEQALQELLWRSQRVDKIPANSVSVYSLALSKVQRSLHRYGIC